MEASEMGILDLLQTGDLFALSAPSGAFYRSMKVAGKSSAWKFFTGDDATVLEADAVVQLLKSGDGCFIGFRSYHAEGKMLQACKDKDLWLQFSNYNFDKWEHWIVSGSTLDDCLLVNRKFPNKQFQASFHKVVLITEPALSTLLKQVGRSNAEATVGKDALSLWLEKFRTNMESGYENLAESICASDESLKSVNVQSKMSDTQTQDLEGETDGYAHRKLNSIGTEAYESLTECYTKSTAQDSGKEVAWLQSELARTKLESEMQAAEYDCKLKSVQVKLQDLKMRLFQTQESQVDHMKDASEIWFALHKELQKARADLEDATMNRLKLDSVEMESTHLAKELLGVKSKVFELEGQPKMSKEQFQNLTAKAKTEVENMDCLEDLLEAADARKKECEEKRWFNIEAHRAELEVMDMKEQSLLEENGKLEKELGKFKERALSLDIKLKSSIEEIDEEKQRGFGKEHAKELREILLSSQHEPKEMNSLIKTGEERQQPLRGNEAQLAKIEQDAGARQEMFRSLEKRLQISEEIVEECKNIESLNEQNGATFRERISELERMLEISEIKCKSNEDLTHTLRAEINELKLTGEKTAEAMKETEVKSIQLENDLRERLRDSEKRCENFEISIYQITEKSVKLEEETEIAARKVEQLQLHIGEVNHIKTELEERLKIAEEQSACYKHSVNINIELESLISKCHIEAEDAVNKIMQLEATLSKVQCRNMELESFLKTAEDKVALHEKTMRDLFEKIAVLDESLKASEFKVNEAMVQVADLELSLTKSRQTERELKERACTAEEMSLQQESTMKQLADNASELKDSVAAMELQAKALKSRGEELELALQKTVEREVILKEELSDVQELLSQQKNVMEEATRKCEELQEVLEASQNKERIAIDKATSIEALLLQEQQEHAEVNAEAKYLTERLSLLKEQVGEAEAQARETAAKLAQAECEISDLQPSVEKLKATEKLVIFLKKKVSTAEERASTMEMKLKAAVLSESKLREELSSHHIVIRDLQASLSQTEAEKAELATQINNTTESFNELKEQFTKERKQIQLQIATIMQEDDALRQTVSNLEDKLQETSREMEYSLKELSESLSRETTLDRELQCLKIQLKKCGEKHNEVDELEQKFTEFRTKKQGKSKMQENIAEEHKICSTSRDVNMDSAVLSGKAKRRKGRETQKFSALETKSLRKEKHLQLSSVCYQLLFFLFTISIGFVLTGFYISQNRNF